MVDDDSSDGTYEVARELADKAVTKKREGQSIGLLYGMRMARYPILITIDADLENDPKLIPKLVEAMDGFDILVASRNVLPRISERVASFVMNRILGIKDVFSNFRAYRRELVPYLNLKLGETFGGEFLVLAKKHGFRIGEIIYEPPPRRSKPRIGGTVKANLRILWALLKILILYITG